MQLRTYATKKNHTAGNKVFNWKIRCTFSFAKGINGTANIWVSLLRERHNWGAATIFSKNYSFFGIKVWHKVDVKKFAIYVYILIDKLLNNNYKEGNKMDIKKVLLISLIVVVILVFVTAVSAWLFDFGNNDEDIKTHEFKYVNKVTFNIV